MVKIVFSKNIDEALKGGQRYRQTVASAIASFLLKKIKTDKEVLKNGLYTFNLKEIVNDIPNIPEKGKEILNNLKLAVIQLPSLSSSLSFKGGAYLRSTYDPVETSFPSDPTDIKKMKNASGLDPLKIPMDPGDIVVKIFIKSQEVPSSEYQDLYRDTESTVFHELKHWIDDINKKLVNVPPKNPNATRYDNLRQRIAANFLNKNEIPAYAEQILNNSRQNKEYFLKNLKDEVSRKVNSLKKTYDSFKEREYIDKAFIAWEYEILKYIKQNFNRFNSYEKDEKGVEKPTQETLDTNKRKVELAKKIEKILPNYRLEESKKLSRYWDERSKARAKRAKRSRNKIDREWASGQQEKSKKIDQTFMSLYEKELEMTEELTSDIDEIMKRYDEEKFVIPNKKNLKIRVKPGKNPYLDPEYRKTKFKSRMDYLRKKRIRVHVGDIVAENVQIQTYGDLIDLINNIINRERLKAAGGQATNLVVDQVLGLIPGGSNVKSAFDFFKAVYSATDDKKTNTFLDKLNVDDKYSAIIDDKVEMAFLKKIIDMVNKEQPTAPIPNDFDINQKLQDYLKSEYENRTLVGKV